jgi:hypothetical protein
MVSIVWENEHIDASRRIDPQRLAAGIVLFILLTLMNFNKICQNNP